MAARFIGGVGAYLPILRLERRAAASALRFSGLPGPRSGRRSVAGWDEDALTIAAEAARSLVAPGPAELVFASTSPYFLERSQAVMLVDALALPRSTRTFDVGGSRRCATSALLRALESSGEVVVAAGEARQTQPGSVQSLAWGDGGAAILASDRGGARFLGGASLAHDLVDVYATRDHPLPYAYEERFVRNVAANEILAPTIADACRAAGIAPSSIALAAVAEPAVGTWSDVARKLGIGAKNAGADLALTAGDLGAAHPLFALGLALAAAKPGDIVLCAGFGSGCDALLFEVTGAVAGAVEAADAMRHGRSLTDYVRFLGLTGGIDLAWGMRAEVQQKAQATVLERNGRDVAGFVGGRDSLGNVQFPKTAIPVNPALDAPEPLVDVRLADDVGRVVSVTADRLNTTPDPPFDFGLVQFENGARVMMELTDRPPDGFAVGDLVAMRFRIKSVDRQRGFRTYFWKATPPKRPLLEES